MGEAWLAGLADRIQGYGNAPPPGSKYSAAWYAAAATATDNLLHDAGNWLTTEPPLFFRPTEPLSPPASMRITPDV